MAVDPKTIIDPRHLISYLPDRPYTTITKGFPERFVTRVYPEDGDTSDLRFDIKNPSVCRIRDGYIEGLKHGESAVLLLNYATFPGPYISETDVYVYPEKRQTVTCDLYSMTIELIAEEGVLPHEKTNVPLITHYNERTLWDKIKRLSGLTELRNLNHSIIFTPRFQTYYDTAELKGTIECRCRYTFDPYEEAEDGSIVVFKLLDDEYLEPVSYYYNELRRTTIFEIDDITAKYIVTMGY